MSFDFAPRRARRGPGLTPMIDVVFLLLVFFMLAARFGQDGAIPLGAAGQGAAWSGPPRLVEISPEGVRLNGAALDEAVLPGAVRELMAEPSDPVILRPTDGAGVQRIVTVGGILGAAGIDHLVLAE